MAQRLELMAVNHQIVGSNIGARGDNALNASENVRLGTLLLLNSNDTIRHYRFFQRSFSSIPDRHIS